MTKIEAAGCLGHRRRPVLLCDAEAMFVEAFAQRLADAGYGPVEALGTLAALAARFDGAPSGGETLVIICSDGRPDADT